MKILSKFHAKHFEVESYKTIAMQWDFDMGMTTPALFGCSIGNYPSFEKHVYEDLDFIIFMSSTSTEDQLVDCVMG